MSLRASGGIPLPVPDRLVADVAAGVVVVLAGIVVAAVAVTAADLSWLAAGLFGAGISLVLALAGPAAPRGRVRIEGEGGVRRLGPTLVVPVRPEVAPGHPVPVWLTPFDVPADHLRRAYLRLRTTHPEVRS